MADSKKPSTGAQATSRASERVVMRRCEMEAVLSGIQQGLDELIDKADEECAADSLDAMKSMLYARRQVEGALSSPSEAKNA